MKWIKRIICSIICVGFAALLIFISPKAIQRFWGDDHAQWVSERFTETLREKNELVVYEIEITGQETVTQDAWLIGTVQKVEIPYTFSMRYTVDLSKADVSAQENEILVMLPAPEGKYAQLLVNEDDVKTVDWLYPLTPERYAEIKQELENKFIAEYSDHNEYLMNAWNIAVSNLQSMFQSVADQSILNFDCSINLQMKNHQPV